MDFSANLSHWTHWAAGPSVVALVYAVARFFEWLDGMVSDAGRIQLWFYMGNVPSDERIDSWAAVFPGLIDRMFGERVLSRKFFLRSCLASICATLFFGVIFVVYGPMFQSADFRASAGTDEQWMKAGFLLLFLVLSLVFNCLPDYASLLTSRAIVRWMARRPTAGRIALLLIVDTAITAAIPIFLYEVVGNVMALIEGIGWYGTDGIWEATIALFTFRSLQSPFFYASLLTSIWVWLYVLSIAVIRMAHKVRHLWVAIEPYLDIEKKPMVAIGRIAGLLAGAGYAMILGLVWLSNHWH